MSYAASKAAPLPDCRQQVDGKVVKSTLALAKDGHKRTLSSLVALLPLVERGAAAPSSYVNEAGLCSRRKILPVLAVVRGPTRLAPALSESALRRALAGPGGWCSACASRRFKQDLGHPGGRVWLGRRDRGQPIPPHPPT